MRTVVILTLDIDAAECIDPPAMWDWPALLDMPPGAVRVQAVEAEPTERPLGLALQGQG